MYHQTWNFASIKKIIASWKKNMTWGVCSYSCHLTHSLPSANLTSAFSSPWCIYFGAFQTCFRSLPGKYYEFYNILVTITSTVYSPLLHRTQAREGGNTLRICWFCRGRYVFCLGLLQLHWVMGSHSDQTLDPLHLQGKKRIKC